MATLMPRIVTVSRLYGKLLASYKASIRSNSLRRDVPMFATQLHRCFCDDSKRIIVTGDKTADTKEIGVKPSIHDKFVPFSDDENEVILDFQEEKLSKEPDGVQRLKDASEDGVYLYREKRVKSKNIFELNLERGKDGVFEVVDMVNALKLEQIRDVVVIKIPPEKRYCDFLVIGTVLSAKHMAGATEFLNKLYKLKKGPGDPFIPSIHDRQYDHRKSPWQVMDFQNLVLHLFQADTRAEYDLETLWTVGPEFDEKTSRPSYEPIVDMLQKHIQFIEKLNPEENLNRSAQ